MPTTLTDRLKSLANAAVAIGEEASGFAPAISTIPQLVGLLEAIVGDFKKVPNDPATGQPMTIEAAQAHLNLATTASQIQDAAIRKQAQDELDKLDGKPPAPPAGGGQ